jgi:hypothetical protein
LDLKNGGLEAHGSFDNIMIKYFFYIALLTGLLIGQLACCTKKDCEDAGVISEIEFYNFSQHDVDTIIVYSYIKNTNFAIPIDSFTTQRCEGSGDPYYAYTGILSFDKDYRIVLAGTGQAFTVSSIETEKHGCNTCFPYRPESDYYIRMKSYLLNGQTKEGQRIQIYN